MHNSIPSISFAIFSGFFFFNTSILFCYTADNTIQRDDFATKVSYLVAKSRLGFFVNFKPCLRTKVCDGREVDKNKVMVKGGGEA